ncbi:MAG TPA: SbcC/MukB-like Walker B domain-containing protein [Fibrobacteraceae bacterium]|nr:SbcC/MukB-like Walker B domain-containing protein [Fibrobacteraceae bacterium]
MRILRISGENLASLRGPFSVDFTRSPFTEAGVFAISGPTGAGKSTLLDALCLALYKRTPRIEGRRKDDLRIGEFSATDTRSLLSRGCRSGHAEVLFESTQGTFRSRWEVPLPKRKLKEGHSTKDEEQHLYQLQSNGEESEIDLRRRSVAEFIGLDFGQFTRTVLLAQGDFRKFLDASASERAELLEKLTDTGMYAELGRRAFERAKAERLTLESLRQQSQGMTLLSSEELEVLRQESQDLSTSLLALRQQEQEARLALEWFGQEQKLQADLASLQQQKEIAQAQWNVLVPSLAELKDWDRAEPLRNLFLQWRSTGEELKTITQKLGEMRDRWEKARATLEQGAQEGERIAKEEQAFRERKTQLEERISQASILEVQAQSLGEAETSSLQRRTESLRNWRTLRQGLRKARSRHDQLQKQITEIQHWLQEDRGDPSALLAQLQIEKKQLEIARESVQWQQRLLENLPAESAEEDFNPQQRQILLEMRQRLTTGSPCPLCGSTAHPYATHGSEAEASELRHLTEQNDFRIQQAAQEQQALEKSQRQLGQVEGQKEALYAQIQNQTVEDHQRGTQQSILTQECRNFRAKKRTLREKLAQLLGEQTSAQIRQQLQNEEQKLQQGKKRWTGLRDQSIQEESSTRAALTSAEERKNTLDGIQTSQVASLQNTRAELGFTKDYANTLLSHDTSWATDLRQRSDSARKNLDLGEGAIRNQEQQIQSHRAGHPVAGQDHWEKLRQDVQARHPAMDQREREVTLRLRQDEEQRGRLQEILKQVEAQSLQAARWERLDRVIGQSTGDRFRRFAQKITLRRLTRLANQHLRQLHGRYQLESGESMELVIVDLDMGNERRSTRSLSGGEGFLVSMALALGLSQMASRQMDIGSLFIDEGFGSLDADTLQNALSVLEGLRQQGRLVGIISHIEGLARQLGAVIQVQPMGDGRSRLSIHP